MRTTKQLRKYQYKARYPITKKDKLLMLDMVHNGTNRESFVDFWRQHKGLTIDNATYYFYKAKKGWVDLPIDNTK